MSGPPTSTDEPLLRVPVQDEVHPPLGPHAQHLPRERPGAQPARRADRPRPRDRPQPRVRRRREPRARRRARAVPRRERGSDGRPPLTRQGVQSRDQARVSRDRGGVEGNAPGDDPRRAPAGLRALPPPGRPRPGAPGAGHRGGQALRVPQVSRGDERWQPGVRAGRAGPAPKRGGPRPAGGPLLPRDVRPELQADPGRAQVTRPDAPIVSLRFRMPSRATRRVTPFTATSEKATLDCTLDPARKSHYATAAYWGPLKEVQVVDDHTVRFVTAKPWPNLIDHASLTNLLIMPAKALKELGPQKLAQQPVGTGQFTFVERKRDERLVLERNPDYWQGPPGLSRVTLRFIPEFSARMAALLSGAIDN